MWIFLITFGLTQTLLKNSKYKYYKTKIKKTAKIYML